MSSRRSSRLNLRQLIVFLSVAGILVTLANSLYAIYQVQRNELISNALNSNLAYANKLAEISDAFLRSARKQLAYSTTLLPDLLNDEQALDQETSRLLSQANAFNAVVVVNADGVIVSAAPATLAIEGVKLGTANAMQSLHARRPIVTDPFVSPAGNYVVSMSHPLFAVDGTYLGYVAGAIYLEEQNLLHNVLKYHHYEDGSYVYVVDRNKTLIYHPEMQRVSEIISGNPVIDRVVLGQHGAMPAVNSKGVAMLAGHAPVTEAGWGIVMQRARSSTLAALDDFVFDVFSKIAPLGLLTLLLTWIAANAIAKPLRQLARHARNMNNKDAEGSIATTRSWYFEADQLRRALLKGVKYMQAKIERLHADSSTDPLTGLLNRRGLEEVLVRHAASGVPFSIIILDVDRFKLINDTHGHGVGDDVIRALADLMRANTGQGDTLCRAGGDEFLLLLPGADTATAALTAERLRTVAANTSMTEVGKITLSLGIAQWPGGDAPISTALKNADDALYDAKRSGRDQYKIATSA